MNASNGNTAAKRLRRWWLTPPRPGLQRLINPIEYRHLRGFGVTRIRERHRTPRSHQLSRRSQRSVPYRLPADVYVGGVAAIAGSAGPGENLRVKTDGFRVPRGTP